MVILILHAYLSSHVVERGIIFVDLAFPQIAALGTTVAMLMEFEIGIPASYLFAFGFTLLGALIFSFTRRIHPPGSADLQLPRMERTPVPQEAIIGIVYVVASAAVILVVAVIKPLTGMRPAKKAEVTALADPAPRLNG